MQCSAVGKVAAGAAGATGAAGAVVSTALVAVWVALEVDATSFVAAGFGEQAPSANNEVSEMRQTAALFPIICDIQKSLNKIQK